MPRNVARFKDELIGSVQSISDSNTAQQVYSHELAEETILCETTPDVLERAKQNSVDIHHAKAGLAAVRDDDMIAYEMGQELCRTFEEMTSGVTSKLSDELIPLMKAFYANIAEMPIKARSKARSGRDGAVPPKMIVNKYPKLWDKLRRATNELLHDIEDTVESAIRHGDKEAAAADSVAKSFMSYEELKAILITYCGKVMKPTGPGVYDPSTFSVAALAHASGHSFEFPCKTNKSGMQWGWKDYYVAAAVNGLPYSLAIFDSQAACHRGEQMRQTSIKDLRGYTVSLGEEVPFGTFSSTVWHRFTVFKQGAKYPQQEFCFEVKDQRDKLFEAAKNMSEERPHNMSEQDLEAAKTKHREEAEAGIEQRRLQQEAADAATAEPQPEDEAKELVDSSMVRMKSETLGNMLAEKSPEAPEQLQELSSVAFTQFIKQLRADPSNTALISRVEDECRAEAFRVWGLKQLLETVEANVKQVHKLLKNKFLESNSKVAPFSGYAIFQKFDLTRMMEAWNKENTKREIAKSKGEDPGGQWENPGPQELLAKDEGAVKRRELRAELEKLEVIVNKFQQYGLKTSEEGSSKSRRKYS